MILDAQNQFSNAQPITATAISTNVIDTLPMAGNPNLTQNLGGPAATFLVVMVNASLTGGTSLAISLESDSTANLATSPTVHYSSGAIPAAQLLAGRPAIIIPLPVGDYERYMGLRYTAVGTFAAGSVSAFLSRDVQNWKPYATATAPNV